MSQARELSTRPNFITPFKLNPAVEGGFLYCMNDNHIIQIVSYSICASVDIDTASHAVPRQIK